jgi:tetratricopeptide (TPR) repeat protein
MKTIRGGVGGVIGALALLIGSPVHGQLAPLKQSAAPSAADMLAGQAAEAQLAGNHETALRLADEAIKADAKEPWGYYNRGDVLASLHRLDDAVEAFRRAESQSPDADVWGKSVAIWGQANVFRQAGRCQEAAPIFERYASLVEKLDREAATLARAYAKSCTPPPAVH